MSEDQAAVEIRRSGCLVRVIARDGRHFPLRGDFRANRVNLTVDRGLVSSVGVY